MKALYESTEKASEALDEIYKAEQSYKAAWAKEAKRNVAFANGEQRLDNTGGAAPVMINNQPVDDNGKNRDRAYVENEIEPIVRTLVSFMTRQKPTVEVFPAGDDEEAKNVAKIGEKILEAKYDMDKEAFNSSQAAYWALTVGSVFSKDYWDVTRGQYVGQLDENGNPVLDDFQVPVEKQTGNNNVAILTALSMTVDHSVTYFDDMPYLGEHYLADVSWAKEVFDRDAPGFTNQAHLIEADNYAIDTLGTLEELKYAVPYGSIAPARSKEKTLISEWFIKPNNVMREGRMIVKAGRITVYDSALDNNENPYFMELEDVMWHPYNYFGYEPYIGRFLHKSLVSPLVPLQVRLNEINGAILENANTMAKPNIVAGVGQLKKGVMNGKGSMVYTYQSIPGMPPPFVLQGTPLPEQFFKEKQSLIDAMVRIAGTNLVMQGQAPKGVTAGSAIQTLLENSTSQQSDMMLQWEKFHEHRFTKKLRVLHKFQSDPDEKLAKYVRMFCRDALQGEVRDFVGARDLSDGLIVKIGFGSMTPKSENAKRDLYKELGKEGLLGPMNEPTPRAEKLRNMLLERIGEEPFDTEENIEMKKAKWENDRIKHGKPVEISQYDNDEIHLSSHVTMIQDPDFLERASDKVKIAADDHATAHKQKIQEKQMQQAASQNPQQEPPPPPAAGGDAPMNLEEAILPPPIPEM